MVAWREASMEIEGRCTDTSFENKREGVVVWGPSLNFISSLSLANFQPNSCSFVQILGALRDTSVIVVTLDLDEVFIIARLYTRTDTHVIYINPTTRAS
ncbi:hypothetical protein JHK85_011586 [Glycine max]|nr:hypothetical protein JHK85_011586 [Glycine max]KAG5067538.1 hypothetical protein JHK86_011269 [Glycine max]